MQQYTELEDQIWRMRDYEEIRMLKAKYLFACDNKDPRSILSCFTDTRVRIDYGAVGVFNSAEQLVDVFRKLACHDHIIEMHHGVNPQIEIFEDGTAKGQWGLHYQQINTQTRTLTQLGGYYVDKYRKTLSGWRIEETQFTVTSTLVLDLGDSAVRTLVAARQMPAMT